MNALMKMLAAKYRPKELAPAYYLHDCPDVPDNYGPQVVAEGRLCPFCGLDGKNGERIEREVESHGTRHQ